MKLDRFFLFLLLGLIVIYFAQGIIYQQGSFISQFSLFVIFSISTVYFFRSLLDKQKKTLFFYAFTTLLILNIISYIFTGNLSSETEFGKFKGLLLTSLPFYSFYYLSSKKIIRVHHLQIFFLITLPIVILQFYIERESILSERSWISDNVVNNIAYFFVFLIPYLFLFSKRKIIAILCSLIFMFYIIQGAKRGALIISVAGMLCFIYFLFKTKKNRLKKVGYITTSILLFVVIYYSYNFYSSNEYLINRMNSISEGSFSNRDIIYKNIFNSWYYSDNFLNILFGFGFGSSLNLSRTGNWAHNDWLEGLAGLGFIGIFTYFLLFIDLIKISFSKILLIEKKIAIFTITTIWFLTSLVSMYYYNATYTLYQNIVLAFLLGSKGKSIE